MTARFMDLLYHAVAVPPTQAPLAWVFAQLSRGGLGSMLQSAGCAALHPPYGSFGFVFAQLSRRPIVRLKTSRPGCESGSRLK